MASCAHRKDEVSLDVEAAPLEVRERLESHVCSSNWEILARVRGTEVFVSSLATYHRHLRKSTPSDAQPSDLVASLNTLL